MEFIIPSTEELQYLRPDPLLWEQELDHWPDVAEAVERAAGMRAGKVFWRSARDYVYALELSDIGRGRPSRAMVYGYWDRYEPRPPEHEISLDLLDFSKWVADIAPGMDSKMVDRLARAGGGEKSLTWPEGSVLRTSEERFVNLPDYPYEPKYVEIEDLRMAYIEHGSGEPVLCLHGEPTWGFLYRRMIPKLSEVGRVIVPDMIGFGRSDKPTLRQAYSYKSFVRWLRAFILALDLEKINLVCQDWGGLIGLRVLAQMPDRFKRLVAMNTAFPCGEFISEGFNNWRRLSQRVPELPITVLMQRSTQRSLTEDELAAYAAPFPSKEYQTAALIFPRLVPTRPDHAGAYENRAAVETLKKLDLPVLLPWAESDEVLGGLEPSLRGIFKNAAPKLTIRNAGHFIQEDAGEEVAGHIQKWMSKT